MFPPTWELNSFHWESHVTFVIYLVVVFFVCVFFKDQEVYTLCLLSFALIFAVIKNLLSVKNFVNKMCSDVCVHVCERLFKVVPMKSFFMQI